MAKKTIPEPKVTYKTMDEMTDSEFLKSVDRMGVPYYFDYMDAPTKSHTSVSGYVSDAQIALLAENRKYRLHSHDFIGMLRFVDGAGGRSYNRRQPAGAGGRERSNWRSV